MNIDYATLLNVMILLQFSVVLQKMSCVYTAVHYTSHQDLNNTLKTEIIDCS